MTKRVYLIILILLSYAFSMAQDVVDQQLPERFGMLEKTYFLTNPAQTGQYYDYYARTGYLGFSGLRKNIRSFFVNGTTILSSENNKRQYLGLTLIGDHEGQFLGQNGSYINYNIHLRLTNTSDSSTSPIYLSAGTSVGFISYKVDATELAPGGSDITLDGNFGFYLYNHRWAIGISANQLFNSTLTPIQETTQLNRHYTFLGAYDIELSPNWSVSTKSQLRLAKGFSPDIDLFVKLNYKNIVFGGGNVQWPEQLAFLGGVDDLPVKNGLFGVYLLYHIPSISNRVTNSIRYEIQMDLKFSKRQHHGLLLDEGK